MYKLLKVSRKVNVVNTEYEIIISDMCVADNIKRFKNADGSIITPAINTPSVIGYFEGKGNADYLKDCRNITVGMIPKTEFIEKYVDYSEGTFTDTAIFNEYENDISFLESFYNASMTDVNIIKKMIEDSQIPIIGIVDIIPYETGAKALLTNYNDVDLPSDINSLFEDTISVGLYNANNLRYVEDMIFLMWTIKSSLTGTNPDNPEET